MKSIRFAFWRRSKNKTDAVKRGLQGLGTNQSTPQMAGRNNLVSSATSALSNNCASNKLNDDYAAFNGMSGGHVEIDKRRCGVSGDLNRLSNGVGFNNIFPTHRSILLYIDETGQAYDLTGQKWSRA